MYMLRSKSVNYVSAYPRIHYVSRGRVVFATSYPRIRVSTPSYTLRLFLGEGLSSPLRIHVPSHPLHDRATLKLFLGKGWSSPLRIHTLQGSAFEVTGYSAVTPTFSWSTEIQFKSLTNLTRFMR